MYEPGVVCDMRVFVLRAAVYVLVITMPTPSHAPSLAPSHDLIPNHNHHTSSQAELERREEMEAPEGVDEETIARRRGQLQKLEAGEGLTKLEKISLAEAALEEGVDVYLKRVQERYTVLGVFFGSVSFGSTSPSTHPHIHIHTHSHPPTRIHTLPTPHTAWRQQDITSPLWRFATRSSLLRLTPLWVPPPSPPSSMATRIWHVG